MANIIKRVWRQNKFVQIDDLKGMLFQAEQAGHTFEISGIDEDGNTVVLTGTPSGVLLRPDNTDVALTCSVSGGVVSATLPAECYDVPGRFGLTIFITNNNSKVAIYAAIGTISRTSSGTASPGTTQSVVDLINAINAAINSIPASYSNLLADIAPTYSDSALYAVGQYAWCEGDLKRCIVPITTSESYTAAHWTSAVLGQDVCDLKSAFNTGLVQTTLTRWESGTYKANGAQTGSSTRIRNNKKVGIKTGIARISCASGFKFLVFGIDKNGNELGSLKSGMVFDTSSDPALRLTDFYCGLFPEYTFKIAFMNDAESSSITTSDGQYCYYYANTDKTLSIVGKAADAKEVGDMKDAIETIDEAVFDEETVELTTTSAIGYWSGASLNTTDSNRRRLTADIEGANKIHIVGVVANGYNIYTFLDSSGNLMESDAYLQASGDTNVDTDYDVYPNSKYVVVSVNSTSAASDVHIYRFVKSSKIEALEDVAEDYNELKPDIEAVIASVVVPPVSCVVSGNDIQIRSKFDDEKYIALNASKNGGGNGGFNYTKYITFTTDPTDGAISTGTDFKAASDDVCPIRYNNSYRGGNHGIYPAWNLTQENHGKTVADIGSIYRSNMDVVIISVPDANHLVVMSKYSASSRKMALGNPTSPLVHVSGGTHTDNIVFSRTTIQLKPDCKNYTLNIRSDNGTELTGNGEIKGNYIDILESYDIQDFVAMLDYLIGNVGSNTNASYYNDSIPAEMHVINTYRFFPKGKEVISTSYIPTIANAMANYIGGTQSMEIGTKYLIPYTSYNEISIMSGSSIVTLPSTWLDDEFPPNKFYQFNTDGRGFMVGYDVTSGEGIPAKRLLNASVQAGWIEGSSNKMYPMALAKVNPSDGSSYGEVLMSSGFSITSFRRPLYMPTDDVLSCVFDLPGSQIAEIDLLASFNGQIKLDGVKDQGKIEVLHKDSGVTIKNSIVCDGSVWVESTGVGGCTLKIS